MGVELALLCRGYWTEISHWLAQCHQYIFKYLSFVLKIQPTWAQSCRNMLDVLLTWLLHWLFSALLVSWAWPKWVQRGSQIALNICWNRTSALRELFKSKKKCREPFVGTSGPEVLFEVQESRSVLLHGSSIFIWLHGCICLYNHQKNSVQRKWDVEWEIIVITFSFCGD